MVITVLVLAALIIAPSLPSMVKSQQKRDYFDALERLAITAANEAKRSGTVVRIVSDQSGAFSIERGETTASGQSSRTRVVSPVAGLSIVSLDGTDGTQDLNGWSLSFYRDGTSSGGSVQFSEGSAIWTFHVDKKGRPSIVAGDVEEIPDEWEAGDRASR